MHVRRYIGDAVRNALTKKMVFVGGPRQVGKTTFALGFLGKNANETHPAYLNWDHPSVRPGLRNGELPAGEPLILLDEIHKYARWRNLVKGIYDTEKSRRRFLITGSARLDYYRKGGDSLAGRYRYFRLHPFSLRELSHAPGQKDVEALLKFGGFPEPLFARDAAEHRIWHRDRMSRVIREDLRDLEHVREITLIEHLTDLLPSKVGSPLSIKSLREDLQIDHKTAERWLQILESLYVCFRVSPYGSPRIRAVKKERKLYLWDWSCIEQDGPRFENMVASQLLKYCHWIEDTEGHSMELRYLRDADKREVDFVVLKDRKPLFAVECKSGEKSTGSALPYFAERTPIPHFYQTHLGHRHYSTGNITVLPFIELCRRLDLP